MASFHAFHDLADLRTQVLGRVLGTALLGVAGGGFEVLAEAQLLGDLGVGGVVVPHRGGNFRKVVNALGRNHAFALAHGVDRLAGLEAHHSGDLLPETVHTPVSELARDGGDDGEFLVGHVEHVAVASHLLANGSQGVFAASLFVFIKNDNIGHVKHFNLLELGVSPEFGGHHIEGMVGHRRDGVAALADAAGFAENEVEADRFGDLDGSVEVGADLRAAATAGETAHVEVVVGERVHADAVPKQGAAGSLSGRVDAQQADLLAGVVALNAEHQFVEQAGFPRAARTGEPDDGHVLVRGAARLNGRLERLLVGRFREREQQTDLGHVLGRHRPVQAVHALLTDQVDLAGEPHQVVNHAHQAHGSPVVGRVDLGDARLVEGANFGRRDGAATAAKDADVLATGFIEQLANVGEVLHVAALVRGQGHGVRVFLNGAVNHRFGGLVVAEVNDFGP